MIDIVVNHNTPALANTMLRLALNGIKEFHIIKAKNLKDGLSKTKSEFVIYLGDGIISTNCLTESLDLFHKSSSQFRKLAMVASAVASPKLVRKTFGYLLDEKGVKPVYKRHSSMPYSIQIGYLPGAILRTSALDAIIPQLKGDDLEDSYRVSVDFWLTGRMCYINPKATYVAMNFSSNNRINFIEDPWQDNYMMDELKRSWKREMVG